MAEFKAYFSGHKLNTTIRNLPDGRVEAVLEGDEEAVQTLIEFCKYGTSGARVTNFDLTWETYTGEFDRFKIKYG